MIDSNIISAVTNSLKEDIGAGDITAALIPEKNIANAEVLSRESAIICGIDWFDEVYRQVDESVEINWLIKEGDSVEPNQCIVKLTGPARALVTGERCAINWLQTLSGVATKTAKFVGAVNGSQTKILDTRKTLPGLRHAQKHAVKIGGGQNHRMGLYDAYLIKENHIASCGSIEKAIRRARELHPDRPVEVEVESQAELQEALSENADIIMLDNFDLEAMKQAVVLTAGRAKLEASGNVDFDQLQQIANTGVDYISLGALTKNVEAVDLSMRFL